MIKKLLAVVLSIAVLLGCTACGGGGEKIDTTKTQIYVSHFAGGFGSEWIDKIEKAFEAKYANTSFEEGKVGVQIVVQNHKNIGSRMSGSFKQDKNQIFINEDLPIYEVYNNGETLDISDVVNGTFDINNTPGYESVPDIEDKNIISRFTDLQKNSLLTGNQYHFIPHYEAYYGLTYDADLFNEKEYFLAADGETYVGEYTVTGPGPDGIPNTEDDTKVKNVLSKGPDGLAGTYDDGLPATQEEFFTLCEIMISDTVIPLVWSGNYGFYISNVINQMIVDYNGYNNEQLAYTFDGTTTEWVSGWDGDEPVVADKAITVTNGYDVFNTAGYYYGLKFAHQAVHTEGLVHDESYNDSFTHTATQNKFLLSNKALNQTPIAMIAEGTWWVNEASNMFSIMSAQYPNSAKADRDLRFMPLPKATADKIGKTTLLESNNSYMFIKSNVAEEYIPLLKLFVQYMNQTEKLQEFTTTTNTPKAMQYELTEAQTNSLIPYGKSIMAMKNAEDAQGNPMTSVLYQISDNSFFRNNKSQFKRHEILGKGTYAYPTTAFHEHATITAKTYFTEHIARVWKTNWANMLG